MSTIEGFVDKLNAHEGTGKFGPYTAYSVKIQTQSGEILPKWYQFGFKKPPLEEGDYVKFDANPVNDTADRYVEGTASKPKNPPARPTQALGIDPTGRSVPSSGRAPKVSELFGEIGGYFSEDDIKRITWAGVRKDALVLMEFLIKEDAVKISKGTTPSHRTQRYEEILAVFDKINTRLYFDNATLRVLDTVEDEGFAEQEEQPLPGDDDEENGNYAPSPDPEEDEEKF